MNASSIESRSLHIGKWGNLVMAIAGVVTAYLSRSDAILIDGLFSGVNFASAIIAAKIGAIVVTPPDRDHPWGYEAYEALYVMFRSLVLVGVTVFAGFGAGEKILAYSFGEEIPILVLGPIVIYTIAMSVICFGLAAWHRSNWTRSGKQSDVLKIESKASFIDGCISAGAGAALMGTVLLDTGRVANTYPAGSPTRSSTRPCQSARSLVCSWFKSAPRGSTPNSFHADATTLTVWFSVTSALSGVRCLGSMPRLRTKFSTPRIWASKSATRSCSIYSPVAKESRRLQVESW